MRVRQQRREPPLHRNQSQGQSTAALRQALLCPWRDGEPDQGAATGALGRPYQCQRVVGQPVESVTLWTGLHPDQPYSCHCSEKDGTGKGTGQHHPTETAEDRWRDHQEHPAHPSPPFQQLPIQGIIPIGSSSASRSAWITSFQCCWGGINSLTVTGVS